MRLFVGVFPPPEVQQAAYEVASVWRRPGDRISWVKVDNLHYTMRFLGELGKKGAERVCDAAREAASARHAFEATLGGVGVFPSSRRARVIWISLAEGAEALTDLARGLEQGLRQRGFERDNHPFKAHLTLGRVRDRDQDWTEALGLAKIPDPAPRFLVDRMCVIESQLNPKGSIYRVHAEAILAC
jgi:2'-5' RNA ligase